MRQAMASPSRSPLLVAFLGLFLSQGIKAQRVLEIGGDVIYESAEGRRTNLGRGSSTVLTHDGRVAFLRGRRFGYGDEFHCEDRPNRNWVALYSPLTGTEEVLFDRPIRFDDFKMRFCIFDQMQLSHDGSILYLVAPVYATSGSLAIINLPRGSITYVPGVNLVYVIESGPHRDELIYWRRTDRRSPEDGLVHAAYPLIHARPDGHPIREISDEDFPGWSSDEAPLLRAYLRKIQGTITVEGKKLP